VYTLGFSPDGRFVATGGGDGWIYIYNVTVCVQSLIAEVYAHLFPQGGAMVWSWYAGAERPGVFELDWQMKDGFNRIALALEGRKVAVVDCTKVPALQEARQIGESSGRSGVSPASDSSSKDNRMSVS
jgi:transducin (beta)-like 1